MLTEHIVHTIDDGIPFNVEEVHLSITDEKLHQSQQSISV